MQIKKVDGESKQDRRETSNVRGRIIWEEMKRGQRDRLGDLCGQVSNSANIVQCGSEGDCGLVGMKDGMKGGSCATLRNGR